MIDRGQGWGWGKGGCWSWAVPGLYSESVSSLPWSSSLSQALCQERTPRALSSTTLESLLELTPHRCHPSLREGISWPLSLVYCLQRTLVWVIGVNPGGCHEDTPTRSLHLFVYTHYLFSALLNTSALCLGIVVGHE